MSHHYQITVEELEELMRDALVKSGFEPEFLERYIEAHRKFGWLRPGTKPELLSLAELHYTIPPATGFGPVIPPMPVRKM